MLPKPLTSRLKVILGDDYNWVMDSFSRERKGSFRVNTLKSNEAEVLGELRDKNIPVEKYETIPGVFLFSHEHDYAIKWTDSFYGGKIYLQSLASMLPVLALRPWKWDKILDICAAPGSKTTQMAMIMENEWLIIALEQNQIRFEKLKYNARLQGGEIIESKKADARRFLQTSQDSFDSILLDAPCSAEWRINLQKEKSYGFWSRENIERKAELQYELLSLALKHLKKGGTLVYSTCTLAPEENEWVISRILLENHDLILEPINIGPSEKVWWKSGIVGFEWKEYGIEMRQTVRILPSVETEGFYIAKLRKK